LIAELLIFKYRRQNISVANTALLTAVNLSGIEVLWEPVRPFDVLSIGDGVGCCEQSGAYRIVLHWSGTKVNGQYYWDVLLHQQLLPAIRDLSGDFLTFQQDNAPAYSARTWDRAAVNLWNARILSLQFCGQPTVLTWTRWKKTWGGIAAGCMMLTGEVNRRSKSGNISTRC